MDGANRRFMSGKERWLKNHLIVYNVQSASNNPFGQKIGTIGEELPICQFDLRKIGGIHNNSTRTGKEYALYAGHEYVKGVGMRTPDKNTNMIRAYFLPWGIGKTFSGKLGSHADFFFTPTLNGCTFAWTGNGPNPSVAHSNAQDSNNIISQSGMDNDLRGVFGGTAPPKSLIKTNYKRTPIAGEDYCATVIGIRQGNGWKFFYQNYSEEAIAGQKVHAGLDLCVPM